MTDTAHERDDEAPSPPPEATIPKSKHTGPAPTGPRGEIAGGLWRLGLVVAATLGLGLAFRVSILLIIFAVVVMIFLHELGHFLTARWSGMKVTEFFIGFGPKIWSFRRGETEYGLKAIPAGAYVRIIGMHNLEEVPPEDEARTYRQKSYPRRMAVAVAGSTMHFIQAGVLLFLVFAFAPIGGGTLTGDPRANDTWVVGTVGEDTAADAAGLEVGDEVSAIDGTRVDTFYELSEYVAAHPEEAVALTVVRDGRESIVTTTLGVREDDPTAGFLGIGYELPDVRVGPVDAVPKAFTEFGEVVRLSTVALADFFTPGSLGNFFGAVTPDAAPSAESETVSGSPAPAAESDPNEDRLLSIYGAVRLGADLAELGWVGMAIFLVQINVFVGIFNLIPLLPFDGGHVAIATYERIRSRKGSRYFADVGKLMPITYAVVLFVLVIGLTSLYLDITNPISL